VGEDHAELREAVAAALRDHDRAKAVSIAAEAVHSGAIEVTALYRDVLVPLLRETGASWSSGELRVWEEHLASQAVRSIVEVVYPAVLEKKAEAGASGRSVLLACPPEEAHDLGLRMVADRFDMAGWTTHFLGADTPPEEIAAAARALAVDAVVLSSSTHYHKAALRRVVGRLCEELPGVSVWVGGPAFAHDREGWSDEQLLDLDTLLGSSSRGALEKDLGEGRTAGEQCQPRSEDEA
jgi:methanogenic corrinoid protein MtbC1